MNPETQNPTPESEEATVSLDDRSTELQNKADELMDNLDGLDFSDMGQVIDFLSELQPSSDNSSVKIDRERILNTFAAHGFDSSTLSSEVDEDDREDFGKHIVLNSLSMLQDDGYISRSIFHLADMWRSKFESNDQVDSEV